MSMVLAEANALSINLVEVVMKDRKGGDDVTAGMSMDNVLRVMLMFALEVQVFSLSSILLLLLVLMINSVDLLFA